MTATGEPCRHPGHRVVELPLAGVRRLCGQHARLARRYPIALHDLPLDPAVAAHFGGRGAPWSSEDDAFLLAHPELPAREAGAHLGRVPAAVYQRRKRLEREGRR